ncbi:thiol reductant ABC exporter subunit CydC [Corallococcus exiguus]|uniref:thiol reductant ABC exporter subunit CydC n=1 Tax=Corallococcus exiguus TaxID=83462 RepID=UPI0015617345|nr:thiol reductant ABC exporter subunit CydC [Corallococcus exiguus]NRD57429.1 thiol reductant ABC exporter subunit CydC [Corallococcus exiguus]
MSHHPLRQVLPELGLRPRTVGFAVALGTASLFASTALGALSAWLIARAAEMPPVLDLTLAIVGVRALGLSRAGLRYAHRLVAHELALGGVARLRARLVDALARGPLPRVLGLKRGDLVARLGGDVDAVGEAVIRSLVPMAIAAGVGVGSVALLAFFLPAAAGALAVSLAVAGGVAPWMNARALALAEKASSATRSHQLSTALELLEGAAEWRVSGRAPVLLGVLREDDLRLERLCARAARWTAAATFLLHGAWSASVGAALVLGFAALERGALSQVELCVVVLVPLGAFEALQSMPAALTQLLRSTEAALRLLPFLETPEAETPAAAPPSPVLGGHLRAEGLACGWPGRSAAVSGIDLTVLRGRSLALTGPSGSGKTTLLLSLAGHLPPKEGRVMLGGVPLEDVSEQRRVELLHCSTEDAHLFDTTLRENLRVVRATLTDDEAIAALRKAGLGEWYARQPRGLDTPLGRGGEAISGGERRRVLLARAWLSEAPWLLLDEPTEHLDPRTAARVMRDLDGMKAHGRGLVVVTHDADVARALDSVHALAPA